MGVIFGYIYNGNLCNLFVPPQAAEWEERWKKELPGIRDFWL